MQRANAFSPLYSTSGSFDTRLLLPVSDCSHSFNKSTTSKYSPYLLLFSTCRA